MPHSDIAAAAAITHARVVALSIVYVADAVATLREVQELRSRLTANVPLLLGGGAAMDMAHGLREAM